MTLDPLQLTFAFMFLYIYFKIYSLRDAGKIWKKVLELLLYFYKYLIHLSCVERMVIYLFRRYIELGV